MHFESDLIILDEPTNNLGVAETQGVLNFVRSARDSGHSCIFIAHNIHHVFQVVDRIVVMRRGRKSSPTTSTRSAPPSRRWRGHHRHDRRRPVEAAHEMGDAGHSFADLSVDKSARACLPEAGAFARQAGAHGLPARSKPLPPRPRAHALQPTNPREAVPRSVRVRP